MPRPFSQAFPEDATLLDRDDAARHLAATEQAMAVRYPWPPHER